MGRTLKAIGGRGACGNFRDEESRKKYWVSGVKRRGSNVHFLESVSVAIDGDARVECQRIRDGRDVPSSDA